MAVTNEIGLRERKKQQTRQVISETARRLFAEQGFEQVSIAEIAKAADVSEGTVFNYFPSKEDLVYSRLEVFEDELLGAVRDRPTGESVLGAFSRFILEPRGFLAARDEASARQLLDVSRMIAESPALLAREQQVFARYTDSLARLIAEETGAAPDDPRPHVAANALIGVHRALIGYVRQRILVGDERSVISRDVRAYGKKALALLEEGLRGYGERR